MVRLLVVDDEAKIRMLIRKYAEFEGDEVTEAEDGMEAVRLCRENPDRFDLIIMDVMMPELDGQEACLRIREFSNVPIIMLTAKSEDADKLMGFECGADDYVTKPFNILELKARVRALLRRANIEASRKLTGGGLGLDADGLTAPLDGVGIPVTTREFNILYKLLSYPNHAFSRSQLMDEFWGIESGTGLRAVDVYITKLRDKFSACPAFEIKTVRGLGYTAVLK